MTRTALSSRDKTAIRTARELSQLYVTEPRAVTIRPLAIKFKADGTTSVKTTDGWRCADGWRAFTPNGHEWTL